MKRKSKRMVQYNGITIQCKGKQILVTVKGETFFANYPMDMTDVSDDLLWAMMYTLFINLENIPPPTQTVERKYTNTMLSFSGGKDSYAVYNIVDCIPIYLNRAYNPRYGQTQQDIIKAIGSMVVPNNMELIRKLYGKPEGFNWGCGYVALLLPLADKLQAGYMALGVVFDDACFTPRDGKVYFVETKPTEHCNNIGKCGVRIIWPTIGLSEYITTEVSKSGRHGDLASSCHSLDKKDCGRCVKCLRKLKHVELTAGILNIIAAWKQRPKMSPTMVHALKRYYPEYRHIDTSLVCDIHEHTTRRWNPDHITEQVLRLNYNVVNTDEKCIRFANQYNAMK